MRSEQQILNVIITTAREDERVRLVVMNGSRANPNAPRDFFQDFDVVYFVPDVTPFIKNLEWVERFGEIMIMEMPEDMDDPPPAKDGSFGYLMQFKDGTRIDLGISPLTSLDELLKDSLTVVLLDKDGRTGSCPPSSESDYYPEPPTAKAFTDCCTEFWWLCTYVVKGLWRREILYARFMMDNLCRGELMKILKWYIGMRTGFTVNPGKLGKYYQRYLEPGLWEMLMKTFADSGYDHTWEALFAMGDLFRIVAVQLADHFGFGYLQEYDYNVNAHLRHVQALPQDAAEMY